MQAWVRPPVAKWQRKVEPPVFWSSLLDQLAAIHEATHVVFAYVNRRPIHGVTIKQEGIGGGQFQHTENSTVELSDDVKQRAREDISILMGIERHTAAHWLAQLPGLAVARFAQRKFGARDPWYDSACAHVDAVIDRVIALIAHDAPDEQRRLRARVDDEARAFVDEHWRSIVKL